MDTMASSYQSESSGQTRTGTPPTRSLLGPPCSRRSGRRGWGDADGGPHHAAGGCKCPQSGHCPDSSIQVFISSSYISSIISSIFVSSIFISSIFSFRDEAMSHLGVLFLRHTTEGLNPPVLQRDQVLLPPLPVGEAQGRQQQRGGVCDH